MRKAFKSLITCVILVCFLSILPQAECFAQSEYTNPSTGYRCVLEDTADLLTQSEENILAETMQDITAYGNVAFKSLDSNPYGDTATYAEHYYRSQFSKESGTVFVIDMDERMIYIFSDGAIYKTITKSYANTITDNVYRYASAADYFICAHEALDQIRQLLEGGRIMQPMKYICNALLSLIIAALLCFAWIHFLSGTKKPLDDELIRKLQQRYLLTNVSGTCVKETRTYSPQSSGGGSSGGGGGGGSSGGGGGHSF